MASPTSQHTIPSIENYLGRANNRIIRVGDYLYVDGGEVAQLVDGKFDEHQGSYPVNETISIDLTKRWTNTTLTMRAIPKAAPPIGGAAIWGWCSSSESGFYTWAGETPYWGTPSREALWKFTSDNKGSGTWESETPTYAYDVSTSDIVRVANGATAQAPDTVFILGGMTSSFIDPNYPEVADDKNQHVPGMLKYNTTTKEWQNISTVAFTPPTGTFLDGDLQYVPGFGTNGEGILVPLGGWIPSIEPAHSFEGHYFLPFSNIAVFDIATSQWYWQSATGSIPKPRRRGCSVGVREDGSESYELFLFGGYNDNDNTTLGDVHVLSLPSFTWSKAKASTFPRTGHACAVGQNNRLMISVGAGGPGGSPNGWQYRDPWPQGIGVLDLTTMMWANEYDPNVERYKRPKVVEELYDNGTTTRTPIKWSSEGVRKLFISSDNVQRHSTSSKTPFNGIIIGTTVASIILLLLMISITIYTLRRRRRGNAPRLNSKSLLGTTLFSQTGLEESGSHELVVKYELPIGGEKWELPAISRVVFEMPVSAPAVELPARKMEEDDEVGVAGQTPDHPGRQGPRIGTGVDRMNGVDGKVPHDGPVSPMTDT